MQIDELLMGRYIYYYPPFWYSKTMHTLKE